MKQTSFHIGTIPALLWGVPTGHLLVAVHGNLSHKADTVLALLAQHAVLQGYQMLSFDLPEHGDRKDEPTLCKAQICAAELRQVLDYAKTQATDLRLFGCSLGAYFSLLACQDAPLTQALFLSPVVDMERLLWNLMTWCSVGEAQLEAEGAVSTTGGQTFYWDYYQYVKAHPIAHWNVPTHILYGSADPLCERDRVEAFAQRFGCNLTVLEEGEHFFHTPEHLTFYGQWLKDVLKAPKEEALL